MGLFYDNKKNVLLTITKKNIPQNGRLIPTFLTPCVMVYPCLGNPMGILPHDLFIWRVLWRVLLPLILCGFQLINLLGVFKGIFSTNYLRVCLYS